MGLSSFDMKICREALGAWTSNENSMKNYLFLEPVDTSHFPTYKNIIKRPMDLGTLGQNLESGKYSEVSRFFSDANLCFENAIKFHIDNPESAWIVKLARDMMKLVHKEKKRAKAKQQQKMEHGNSGPALKLKVSKKDKNKTKNKDKGDSHSSSYDGDKSSSKPSSKLKLSLKNMSSNDNFTKSSKNEGSERKEKKKKRKHDEAISSASNDKGSLNPPTSKVKLSLKLKSASSSGQSSSVSNSKSKSEEHITINQQHISEVTYEKVKKKKDKESRSRDEKNSSKPSKPKLKLTLSLNKKTGDQSQRSPKETKTEEKKRIEENPSKLTLSLNKKGSDQTQRFSKEKKSDEQLQRTSKEKKNEDKSSKSSSSMIKKQGDLSSKVSKDRKNEDNSSKPTLSLNKKGDKVSRDKKSEDNKSPKLTLSLNKKGGIQLQRTPKDKKYEESPNKLTLSLKKKGNDLSQKNQKEKRSDESSNRNSKSPATSVSRGKELPSSVAAAQVAASQKKSKSSDGASKKSSTSAPASSASRGKELPKGVVLEGKKSDKSSSEKTDSDKKTDKKNSSDKKRSLASSKKKDRESKTSTSPSQPKITLSIPNQQNSSRGKELPKGVVTGNEKKSDESVSNKRKSSSSNQSHPKKLDVTQPPKIVDAPMNVARKAQCHKVLSAIKRRNSKNIVWFLKPVNDKNIIQDYISKIPNPMDFGTITSKLEKNQYQTVGEFVLDVRRVAANCLRYNAEASNDFRPIAEDILTSSEDLLHLFLASKEPSINIYPKLMYCWKKCLKILDAVLALQNKDDGHQTAHYFLHPVSFFWGGEFPPEYKDIVKTPMDFGTVTSKLIEGFYQSVDSFVSDCKLISDNCKKFYKGKDDGEMFTAQAGRLENFLLPELASFIRYDQSSAGSEAKKNALNNSPIKLPKPSNEFLLSILQDLRNTTYTDRYTKITESATRHFEKPVDLNYFPDYRQYVETPMELEMVDKKIASGAYSTPEDFEYDVILIFKNCEKYNVPKHNDHIVQLSKFCAKSFRKMYSTRMKAFEANGGKYVHVEEKKEKEKKRSRSPSPIPEASNTSKKSKISSDNTSKSSKSSKSLKIVPPSSSDTVVTSAPKSKSPKPARAPKPKNTAPKPIQNDGPVPLHVAIAQIKESFPVRRPYKVLESWEGSCARFFRDLMRHPWLSAARPKFIFHVPVPILFPEIKEAYEAKIAKPMDLMTAECKLLAGDIYTEPQEFVDDLGLVFANAVTFNRAGHEEGEPMSCAYYDASRHLLRYTRWLSLDYLSPFLKESSKNDGLKQGPISHWSLTKCFQKEAIEELETMVLNQIIERSEEGDRYTWMEVECEKLLKALRHQSDLKYMTFFIQPNYPADYTAYVSKPMDWERVQKTLQQRKYNKFGDIVEELRLIFSNALKYNVRAKGTETVSGRAYDAAVFMSSKLELAIHRMLISVSDRLEREKIDQVIAEREIEAAERAEEERIRTAWHKEREKSRSANIEVKARVEPVVTVKLIQRRSTNRRDMDFDFPFFDEDDGHHEQTHMEAMRQQKLIFEKQQRDRANMSIISKAIGFSVMSRLLERSQAIAWSQKILENKTISKGTKIKKVDNGPEYNDQDDALVCGAAEVNVSAASLTSTKTQNQKVRIVVPTKQKQKRKKSRLRSIAVFE